MQGKEGWIESRSLGFFHESADSSKNPKGGNVLVSSDIQTRLST